MRAASLLHPLVAACALSALSCQDTSTGCPSSPVAVRVDFYGDVIGTGEIKLVPARFGSLTLEGTVSRGGAAIVKIGGPGACNHGVIGATFRGESQSQKGVEIEDGKFAAVFGPRPLGGRLTGSWDAVIVHHNGVSRPVHGFFRDERPQPAPSPVSSATAAR